MANSWSKEEVTAAVHDYFSMLRAELSGKKYNKSSYRRSLINRLNNRTDGSVELKHQNISAVMIEMGLPYIGGYKPRSNYQRQLLPEVINEFLAANKDIYLLFQSDVDAAPEIPSTENILDNLEQPPTPEKSKKHNEIRESPVTRIANNINYIEREAKNLSLGDAGEKFVINFEKARLIRAGKVNLADKIEQTSITVGPSAGFDIHSYEINGKDRFIEAKTTRYGKNTPFYVTPNELKYSRENRGSYYLYRVFQFRRDPKLFTLHGAIDEHCQLTANEFKAKVM